MCRALLASPLALVARSGARQALSTVSARGLSSQAAMPAARSQPQDAAGTMDLDGAQISALLEMLDSRQAAPVFAGVKWQQDCFGVWTEVPWSDCTEFTASVTRPGHVVRNGTNYFWHEHPNEGSDPLAAPRGVWVVAE